jgi:hypothetical protein
VDFIEACARILFLDEWFPLPARIIEVCAECASERHQRDRIRALPVPARTRPLVCPHCHGARWVRLGGASQIKTKAGPQEGDRIQSCPGCTTQNRYDPHKEVITVGRSGGVEDEDFDVQPDMAHSTWRAPRRDDGSIDIDALYRQSRILRKLDPDVDERQTGAAGFTSFGELFSKGVRSG